jgi:peptide chain release factor 1
MTGAPIWDALKKAEARFAELTDLLGQPDIASDPRRLRDLARERSRLEATMATLADYRKLTATIRDDEAAVASGDPELAELAQAELPDLRERLATREAELIRQLLPRDPDDDKNVIVEIRAGTGGGEASLFAADVYRMFSKFAERRGWKQEVMSSSPSEVGGFKEIIFLLSGESVYRVMKFESGVHRVQRVPDTEASGRIHTSAATVAVLPEVEDVDVQIDEKDLRVDVYRAGGPGGQGVNYYRLGGADHASAHRAGGDLPGRALADQEPGEGDEGAARPALRRQAPGDAGQVRGPAQVPGFERRSQRQDPHLQLPAGPGHRPPN